MSTAALILAVISICVAVGALVISIWQARINAKRFRREGSAVLTAEVVGMGTGGSGQWGGAVPDPCAPIFRVRNTGAAPARRLSMWVQHPNGERYSQRVGGRVSLMPGEDVRRTVRIREDWNLVDTLYLWYSWEDADGVHTLESQASVPLT